MADPQEARPVCRGKLGRGSARRERALRPHPGGDCPQPAGPYLQNGRSKTIAAPYVLRAYPGAPVATPLEWSEVRRGLHLAQFNIANALDRFTARGDLFAGVLNHPQQLETALAKLGKLFR